MSLWTAFDIGLKTALDPFHVTTALCFFLVLCAWGKSWVELVTMGAGFMFMVFSGELLFCYGFFDVYTTHIVLSKAFKGFYLLFAVLFLGKGVAHFRDWVVYYQGLAGQSASLSRITQEAVFIKGLKQRPFSLFKIFWKNIVVLLLGVSLVLLSSLAPRDEYLFILFSSLMAGREVKFVLMSFLLYSLAVCLPLMLIWGMILITARSLRAQRILDRWYSQRTIVLSALFIGLGIGLTYFTLRVI